MIVELDVDQWSMSAKYNKVCRGKRSRPGTGSTAFNLLCVLRAHE
jgi:hypothetical protein